MKRILPLSLAISLACTGFGTARAATGSLPTVEEGPRPGPAALYQPVASAPILANVGRWQASPILVSGAAAYRKGEFIYQDYLYDDHGANTSGDGTDPQPRPGATDVSFGGQTGDVVYPTNEKRYRFNNADLVELRVRLDPEVLAFRFTLNTLKRNGTTAIAVGIDANRKGRQQTDWRHGLGSLGPLGLEHVLYTDGRRAALDARKVAVRTSLKRNQIEVDVPRRVLDPDRRTWRIYAVTGIADGKGGFAALQDAPDSTHPGGAHGTDAPPVFNAAFRFEKQHDEPMLQGAECQGSRTVGCGNWREHGQALALAARDIRRFSADVDFARLARGITDNSLVPKFGYMNRIYVSHLRLGEGVADARPWLLGRLQPYSLYVPKSYRPGKPTGFLLVLHSLAAGYNQFEVFSPHTYRDLCEERHAICMTTEGRGPDGWYQREAELDVFETWADVAHRYSLDPNRTAVMGYSMGGYGTFKLTVSYPDLFAKAFPVVGPPGEGIWAGAGDSVDKNTNTFYLLDNFRNVPAFIWNGAADELVPAAGTARQAQRFDDLGYRYRQDYYSGDHFALALIDSWDRGKRFLRDAYVDRNPSHIVFRVQPGTYFPKYGLIRDHAYWVWDVRMRSETGDPPTALVDVRSMTSGFADPATRRVANAGPNPLPHTERGIVWEKGPKTDARNMLVLHLENVASVTIGLDRAHLHMCGLGFSFSSDGPAVVRLVHGGDVDVIRIGRGEGGGGIACAFVAAAPRPR